MCAMNECRAATSAPDTRSRGSGRDRRLRTAPRDARAGADVEHIFRARVYLRSRCDHPLLSIVLVLILAPLLRVVDAWLGWRLSGLSVSGAQALYQTTITLTLSFVVFTFGSLLVAIQVAGGQLTPRIIATTLLRDNVVRYSVGLFVFTLVFAVMALNRLDKTVYDIVSLLTAMLAIACMAMFSFSSTMRRVCSGGQHSRPRRPRRRECDRGGLSEPQARRPRSRWRSSLRRPTRVVRIAVRPRSSCRRSRLVSGDARRPAASSSSYRKWGFRVHREPLFELYGDLCRSRTIACTRASLRPRADDGADPLRLRSSRTSRSRRSRRNQRPDDRGPGTRPAASTPRIVGRRCCAARRLSICERHAGVIFGHQTGRISSASRAPIFAHPAQHVQIARRLRAMLGQFGATYPLAGTQCSRRNAAGSTSHLRRSTPWPMTGNIAAVPDRQGLEGRRRWCPRRS